MSITATATQVMTTEAIAFNANATSAAITINPSNSGRSIFVKADCGGTPDATDIINVYFQPIIDIDQDATDDTINQGDFVGVLDLNTDDPANKEFGLFTTAESGYFYVENEGDTNTNTVSIRMIENVVS